MYFNTKFLIKLNERKFILKYTVFEHKPIWGRYIYILSKRFQINAYYFSTPLHLPGRREKSGSVFLSRGDSETEQNSNWQEVSIGSGNEPICYQFTDAYMRH